MRRFLEHVSENWLGYGCLSLVGCCFILLALFLVEWHRMESTTAPTTFRKMTPAEAERFEQDLKDRTERTSCFCGSILVLVVVVVVVVSVTALSRLPS
jgi:hypothetical protein